MELEESSIPFYPIDDSYSLCIFLPVKLVAIGDAAPDFDLIDHEGNNRKLSSFRGKRVLLSFYRFGEFVNATIIDATSLP